MRLVERLTISRTPWDPANSPKATHLLSGPKRLLRRKRHRRQLHFGWRLLTARQRSRNQLHRRGAGGRHDHRCCELSAVDKFLTHVRQSIAAGYRDLCNLRPSQVLRDPAECLERADGHLIILTTKKVNALWTRQHDAQEIAHYSFGVGLSPISIQRSGKLDVSAADCIFHSLQPSLSGCTGSFALYV